MSTENQDEVNRSPQLGGSPVGHFLSLSGCDMHPYGAIDNCLAIRRPDGIRATKEEVWAEIVTLRRETGRLKERERLCETMDKAEKLALIRALQEIRDAVGLLGDGVSPRQIVDAVISLSNVGSDLSCPTGGSRNTQREHGQD